MSIRQLCEMLEVNRRWYYARQAQGEQADPDVELRDAEVEAPDVVWVADITYIRLPSSFVYLATLLDAYSRKCIGWNLAYRCVIGSGSLRKSSGDS